MSRRQKTAPSRATASEAPPPDDAEQVPAGVVAARRDLSDLPVLGITRRRAGYFLGVLVACWVLVVFARQVSEAAAAGDRAADLRAGNDRLAASVAGLQSEFHLVRNHAFIALEARRYRIGEGREIAFQLANDAPPLEPDAPGSASVKLGAIPDTRTPLESWLEVLFGPSR